MPAARQDASLLREPPPSSTVRRRLRHRATATAILCLLYFGPMSLLADVRHLFGGDSSRAEMPLSFNQLIDYFKYGSAVYPYQTMQGSPLSIAGDFEGLVQGAYKSNGVVFACSLARLMLFAEARMAFRQVRSSGPGKLFGTPALGILERPWPNGTTGDLLSRAITDVDLAGTFYSAREIGGRLSRLRPDWVELLVGSDGEPGDFNDPTAEVLAYLYYKGGKSRGAAPIAYDASRVATWSPIPDPLNKFVGLPWVSRVVPQIRSHTLATEHKGKFFENGATPNMIVTLDPSVKEESFERWVKKFREGNEGAENAYRTVFLGGGASAQVVGVDLKQLDFKATQGADETVIAAAAGVPPVIVGLSEGLEAATYSNYAQARRRFADMTIRPLWRSFTASQSKHVAVPAGAELWYDDRDIPALREDAKDRADIQQVQAATISALVSAGYEADSIVQAVMAEDWSLLVHSGMTSVQLHPPGDAPAQPQPTQANSMGVALLAQLARS